MKSIYTYIIIILVTTLLYSCEKFIETDLPINKLTSDFVFSDSATSVGTTVGLYARIMTSTQFLNGYMSIYPGLSADDIYPTSTSSAIYTSVATNNIPNDSFISIWTNAYNSIYQSNEIIEKMPAATAISAKLKDQLIGEAKVIRALNYFYLVNLYGDVPLITTTEYADNGVMPRTESNAVYLQIITDLKEAETQLAENYPTSEKVRANRWSAAALLARVYLYRKDWTNAIVESSKVINSGVYSLATPAGAFLANNSEAILQFIPTISTPAATAEGGVFNTSTATIRPTFTLNSQLYASFTATDLRKSTWIKINTISGTAYPFPYKFKVRSGVANVAKTEYNIVLRLAEQYMIRAEAYTQTNQLSLAITDMDMIRNRAGLTKLAVTNPSIAQPDLLTEVYLQNRQEFFAEWGHRWFDLKRTGMATTVLGPQKAPNWQETDVLYPIPNGERLLNPFLTQNPGYN